jgi:anti-sigma B factor antagonist
MAARVSPPGERRGSTVGSAAAPAAGSSNGPRPGSSNGQRRFARRGMAGAGRRFVAATEQLDDGTPVVCVLGEVDLATAPELEQALVGVGDDRTGAVIVDLTGCTFLDCSGLRALVATRGRLERSNRRLGLVLPKPGMLRIFQITGLDELFEIYPSLGAAVSGNRAQVPPSDPRPLGNESG